ncbi:type VI secretion system baseplate subunit TssF [Ascidiaceihabitans sp.]|uniref:type VI secretion system baseplate subunit TssF n=2 Tax=Ascidiaceihabitans sp. TaxID=1872644 RepID=UPI0032998220
MKKSFRDAYNRELSLLYERAAEFAAEFPGIADSLGGVLRENTDPGVAGLLEGTAFLSANVQHKMDEEFRNFTTELLDQIFPEALAPVPSIMMAKAQPPWDNKDLAESIVFDAESPVDARFVDADQRVSCQFRLCAPLTLWPLRIEDVSYLASPAPLEKLGLDTEVGSKAGIQIEITRPEEAGEGPLSDFAIDELPLHFVGEMSEAAKLYEQIQCNMVRATIRYLDKNGDATFKIIPLEHLHQVGFGHDERLLPRPGQLFDGFALLREAFAFPRKFLGVKLVGLQQLWTSLGAQSAQIILEFDRSDPVLAARLGVDDICLFAAPAVNLFVENARQRVDRKRHEFEVRPDRSPITHFEVQRIEKIYAHYTGNQSKVKVYPLYGVADGEVNPRQTLYFTSRRKPRRLTEHERRFGVQHRYRGTETFVALYEPPDTPEEASVQRLQITTLCSNRHLPEYLPIAGSQNDFYMSDDTTVNIACVAGPTPPREPLSEMENDAPHRAVQGDVYWRLISYLSLSHFGLDDRGGRDGAAALREMLSLFADLSDSITEAQIEGLIGLETSVVTQSIQRNDGFFPARGLKVKLTFDEENFEGSGIVLLGAILDRFLAEYASVNSFTQTQIASRQRGVLKTFAARTGNGPLL